MSNNLNPTVFNTIGQLCEKLMFLSWLWHDKNIVNNPIWHNYQGDTPPWEWTSTRILYKVLQPAELQPNCHHLSVV